MSQANKENIETGGSRIKFWGGAVIVLMIILMFMPWNVGNRTRGGRESVLRGGASGGRKVMSNETDSAAAALEALEEIHVSIGDPRNPRTEREKPLLTALWGEELATAMKRHPEAYHLLVQESRKFGLGDNPRTLGPLERDKQDTGSLGVFNNGYVYIRELHPLFGSELYAVSQADGPSQIVTKFFVPQQHNDGYVSQLALSTLPPIRQEAMYAALRDLLSVQAVSSLASTAVKPSTVMVDQMIARRAQTFTLQVASIDARPLIDMLSVPTDAELQSQLSKYADTPPGSVTTENPFGFGYQVQNAVKLQMFIINRADVRAVVQAEKSAYDWEVEARMAYAKDAKQFASLAPTTAPATVPTTGPSTAPANSADTVAPFDQIKAGAVRMMVEKATAARVDDIARKIRTTMSLDYQSWATARNTKSTTQPSSLGVNYESLEYLNKLAAVIQAEPRFKVLPVVRSEQNAFLDAEALNSNDALAGMTYTFEANVANTLGIRPVPIPAAVYIVNFTKPFMKRATIERAGGSVLEPMKPSDLMVDEASDRIAFMRITDAALAHAATDLEPLRNRLIADVKRADAQAKALDKANAAIETIKRTGTFEVPGAPVSTVVVASLQTRQPVPPELGLNGEGFQQFHEQLGSKLLGDPSGKPVDVLNVPLAQKVFVAQRVGLASSWTNQAQLDEMRIEIQNVMNSNMVAPGGRENPFGVTDKAIANAWIDVEAVLARNEWKSANEARDGEKQ